jgi:hypothetical protein
MMMDLNTISQFISICFGILGLILLGLLIAITFRIYGAVKNVSKIVARLESLTNVKTIWDFFSFFKRKKRDRDHD